ncbi:MAG: flagellar export chaperone FliS [Bacillota bacterium]|nr:flagellar export chaperone FliS [Bacillota bacterium]
MSEAAQDRYRMVQISTSSPTRLVVLMYEGAARFFGQAGVSLGNGDHDAADYWTGRACSIVQELLSTLDFQAGGEIARHLGQVYTMALREALRAKLGRDASLLKKLSALFSDLKSGWMQLSVR